MLSELLSHLFDEPPELYHTSVTASVLRRLLLIGEVLLHHTTDLPICIEVFANGSLFIEWAPNLLGSTANGAISCTFFMLARTQLGCQEENIGSIGTLKKAT